MSWFFSVVFMWNTTAKIIEIMSKPTKRNSQLKPVHNYKSSQYYNHPTNSLHIHAFIVLCGRCDGIILTMAPMHQPGPCQQPVVTSQPPIKCQQPSAESVPHVVSPVTHSSACEIQTCLYWLKDAVRGSPQAFLNLPPRCQAVSVVCPRYTHYEVVLVYFHCRIYFPHKLAGSHIAEGSCKT